jgi:hypothetical protein
MHINIYIYQNKINNLTVIGYNSQVYIIYVPRVLNLYRLHVYYYNRVIVLSLDVNLF